MSSPSSASTSLLSQRLVALADACGSGEVKLGFLLESLGERSHAFLVFVLVIVFLQPIPLPGVSTAFGLAVAVVGFQLALDRPPWLPHWLANRSLSANGVRHVCVAGQALFRRFERLIRPRLPFMHTHPLMRHATGAAIAISGLLLALPLPIPVSNFLPALTVALLALGTLEEDGLLVGAGYVAFAVCLAFFVMLVALPFLGFEHGRKLLGL